MVLHSFYTLVLSSSITGEDGVVSLPNEINPPFREPTQKRVIPVEEDESEVAVVPRKKRRIAKFLVDERMQLTDEELKVMYQRRSASPPALIISS